MNGNDEEKQKDWTKDPMDLYCLDCNATVTTQVSKKYGSLAHALACIYCQLGCFPCYPYMCMSSVTSMQHNCPRCAKVMGTYQPENFNECTRPIFWGVTISAILTVVFWILVTVWWYMVMEAPPVDHTSGAGNETTLPLTTASSATNI